MQQKAPKRRDKPAHGRKTDRRAARESRPPQLVKEEGASPEHNASFFDKLKRRRRFLLGAGEDGRFASFDALVKGRGRRHLREWVLILAARPNFAAGAAGMSADESTAPFLSNARQPHTFVGKQKYAKIAFSACHLAASEIARRQFRRRGSS